MKWTRKGHELDHVYDKIQKKDKYYIFGAGDYGSQLYQIMKDEITVLGYIDNSPARQGQNLHGQKIYQLSDVKLSEDTAIIVAVSQIARSGLVSKLDEEGYIEGEDYFKMELFLSVWYVYRYNKVYFMSVSMLPSTACNLNCELCLNFNPYAGKPDVRSLAQVKEDIDLFFQAVDYVMLYHVSGGEPFLYPYFAEVIEYLGTRYRDRILTLRTVTNGTVVPPDSLLQRLSEIDFEITVDDYRDAVPDSKEDFERLIQKLNKYKIKYEINKAESWIDLAPTRTDHSMWTEEQLIEHFDNCAQTWQELRDGKLYSCNYDGYATVARINEQQKEEVFDLGNFQPEQKKELVEFRLGYNEKGYTNLCKHCRGFYMDNPVVGQPAAQKK